MKPRLLPLAEVFPLWEKERPLLKSRMPAAVLLSSKVLSVIESVPAEERFTPLFESPYGKRLLRNRENGRIVDVTENLVSGVWSRASIRTPKISCCCQR
jgi:hypothetical protein